MSQNIILRKILESDCKLMSDAFKAQGWDDKPISLYQRYLNFQTKNQSDIIIASSDNEFAGYLTIN